MIISLPPELSAYNKPHSVKRGDFATLYQGCSVDDLVIHYMKEHNIPGLALAIVQAPYIPRVVGYGFADTTTKQLVSSNTLFQVGQMTNAFTAVAIMQLKEAGKLDIVDKVSKYIPAINQELCIKDLMTHTSGLGDYRSSQGFIPEKEYSKAEILTLIQQMPINFTPGTKYEYSASNYYLLGLIIEKASAESYENYITKNQFERLGLRSTYLTSTLDRIKNEVKSQTGEVRHEKFKHEPGYINPLESASGYIEREGTLVVANQISWGAGFADSSVVSSAQDISLWDLGLAGDILVKDAVNRGFLYTPYTLKDGSVIPHSTGWFYPGHKGLMTIQGHAPGFSSHLSRYTDANELLCVTVLANKDGLPDINLFANRIAAAYNSSLSLPQSVPWGVTMESPHSVNKTLDQVSELIRQHNGTIFARINHTQEAKKAGLNLLPTEVLLIGNPSVGTRLMQANQEIALDLPLRIASWQDELGHVWLSFTNPVALAAAYNLEIDPQLVRKMYTNVVTLCQKAIQ